MTASESECEEVAVLAPLGRDAALIVELLERKGFKACSVQNLDELAVKLVTGLGAAIIAEEALAPTALEAFRTVLSEQQPWSDFPLVLLSAHPKDQIAPRGRSTDALQPYGNVTVLDRPVQTRSLLSAVEAALRARRRQYDARRAIDHRDRFLAMLGHELRNPLAAIVFASDLVARASSLGAAGKPLKIIERQARHLSRLVDDLLEVSRLTSGKYVLHRQTLELGTLVERSILTVEALQRARHQTIRFDAGAEPAYVTADPIRLEQVFNNLLTNAIKYTQEGGTIEVLLETVDESVLVRVRDDGVGLAPAMLTQIFDPFAQVDGTLDRSQGGLGLGLTLVRGLVEMHGGRVEARSEGVGKGSEFIVTLPLAAPASVLAFAPRPVVEPVAASSALHLVLVEDNCDIREALRDLLSDQGHGIEVAVDGPSGVALIVRTLPDLAFVDIGLPGLDGYQVAQEVRRQVGGRVKLVALSGYCQPEDRRRAIKAGFDAHLRKPIDLASLDAVLKSMGPEHSFEAIRWPDARPSA